MQGHSYFERYRLRTFDDLSEEVRYGEVTSIFADCAATGLWHFPYILAKHVVPKRNVRINFVFTH